MYKRDKYLFFTQTRDRFQALSVDNSIYKWCMQTGKNLDNLQAPFNISEEAKFFDLVENSAFEVFKARMEQSPGQIAIFNQGVLKYTLLYLKEPI